MLRTDRLVLRQWTEDDFLPFAEMCADPAVMAFFPKVLSRAESFAMARRIMALIDQRGWGFWAVEIPDQAMFIGFVGLHTPSSNLPFAPCVEVGWRLSQRYWGQGYATEAAREALNYGFDVLGRDEIVSFTTSTNVRSRNVMEKLGMINCDEDFMHPDIEPGSPLRKHVLYKVSGKQWR